MVLRLQLPVFFFINWAPFCCGVARRGAGALEISWPSRAWMRWRTSSGTSMPWSLNWLRITSDGFCPPGPVVNVFNNVLKFWLGAPLSKASTSVAKASAPYSGRTFDWPRRLLASCGAMVLRLQLPVFFFINWAPFSYIGACVPPTSSRSRSPKLLLVHS